MGIEVEGTALSDWAAFPDPVSLGVPYASMTRVDALLFMVGMALSLGSIATFIVMNVAVGSSSDATMIHHQRLFAGASSRTLTVPGVCMLLAATILSSGLSGRPLLHDRWSLAQLVLAALTFINTVVLMPPLLAEVSLLAEQGVAQGRLPEGYRTRKKFEDCLGAANLLMIATMLLLEVFRP